MKKVITVIAVCLVACLLIVGLVPTENPVYAAQNFMSDAEVPAVKPEVVNVLGNSYYRINDEAPETDAGGNLVYKTRTKTSGMEISKWKWVLENVNHVLNKSSSNVVLIEQDLDFSGYDNLYAISALISAEDQGIKFSIKGGRYNAGDIVYDIIPEITNYFNNDAQIKNNAFITKLNGGTISKLKFTGFTLNSSVRNADYVGFIAEMQSGTLSQVSVNGNITAQNGDAGGLIGKIYAGDIFNCDFNGDVTSVKGDAGGLVGKVLMQETKGQQFVNIKNSYVIANNIKANEVAGGVIGNIKYHRGTKYSSGDVKITLKNVYSKVSNIKLTRAQKIKVNEGIVEKEVLNFAPYGIVGKVSDRQGFEDLGPVEKPAPGEVVVPKDALPLNEMLVFNNIVAPKVITNTYKNLNSEEVADGNYALAIVPQNIPQSCYVGSTKSIPLDEFNKSIHFYSFPVENWIMDADHLELKYKLSNIAQIKVTLVQNGVTNSIVEQDSEGNVSYIVGRPVIFTVNLEDGVYLRKIVGKKDTLVVGTIYEAKDTFPTNKDNLFTEGNAEYGGVGQDGAAIHYDYKDCQLIIQPDRIVDYDEIVFNFNNTDAEDSDHTMNTYKAGFSVVDVDSNPITTDMYYYDGANYKKISGLLEGTHIKGENGKNEGMKIYIPRNQFAVYRLNAVKIVAKDGTEMLTQGSDKGYQHLSDETITVDGTNIDCVCYVIRVNHLGIKLYNHETFDVQFELQGQKAQVDILNKDGVELVYSKYLKVDYIYNGEVTKEPINGREYDIRFTIDKANNGNGYVFNLLTNVASPKSPEYKQCVQVKVDNTVDKQVKFESNGTGTDGLPIFTGSVILENITFSEKTEIYVNLARLRKVNISNAQTNLFNPPSFSVANLPIVHNNAVTGFASSQLGFSGGIVESNQALGTVYANNLDDTFKTNFENFVKGHKFFTIHNESRSADFEVIEGVNPEITLITSANYTNFAKIKLDGVPNNSLLGKTVGEVDMTGKNAIQLDYEITEYVVSIQPAYIDTNSSKLTVDGDAEKLGVYRYGYTVNLTNSNFPEKFRDNYEFVAWQLTDDVPAKDADNKEFKIENIANHTIVYLVLRPKYSVKFKVNNAGNGMGFILKDNIDNYTNGEIFRFGSELKGSTIKFTIITSEDKYAIDVDALKTYINDVLNLTGIVNVTGDSEDCHKAVVEINVDDLIVARPATYTNKTLDTTSPENLKKNLDITLNVDFSKITKNIKLKASTYDEAGHSVAPIDKVSYEIDVFSPDKNAINKTDLDSGKVLTFDYGTSYRIDVKEIAGENFYQIKVLVNGVLYENFFTGTENRVNAKYYVYKADLKKDIEIEFEYHKVTKDSIFKIDSEVQIFDGSVWKPISGAAEVIIESDKALSGNRNEFLGDSKISVSYNPLLEKYTFASWELVKLPENTTEAKNTVNFQIGKLTSNYKVVLKLKEKTYDIVVKTPHITVDSIVRPIGVMVSVDGNDFIKLDKASSKLGDTGIGLVYSEADKTFTLKNVKHNAHIYFKLDSVDNNYVVDYWNNGELPYLYAENNDLGLITENKVIDLKIKPKKVADPEVEDKIKVSHSMAYDGISKVGNTKATYVDESTVILEAIPSKGTMFVKWLKDGAECATTPKISVNNEQAKYEAVFATKEFKINFVNDDLVTVTGVSKAGYGEDVTLSLSTKPGYAIDKLIINGKKEVIFGSVKSFTIYDIDADQNIEIVYRKAGNTAQESQVEKSAKNLVISTVVIAVIAFIVNRKISTKYRGKKNRKINVD